MDTIEKKVRDNIIDVINAGAAGRLIIVAKEKSKQGIDLSVERRGEYKEKPYNFQINSFVGYPYKGGFAKDFSQKDFRAEKNFYLLFVSFDEVTQEIGNKMWVVPSLQLQDLAEAVVSDKNEKMLRFEASLTVEDAYAQFLIDTQDLGRLLFDSFEVGDKASFKKNIFLQSEKINIKKLTEFICQARKNTYAVNQPFVDNPRLQGSVQQEFQKTEYYYCNIFFEGNAKIIGQEIVYFAQKPVWMMNYLGDVPGKAEDNFLKEALLSLSEECRFGKACEYKKREFIYQDTGKGTLEEFFGQEQITQRDKIIYTLHYQAGMISI